MTGALLVASLLAASWSDGTGRLRCGVPEGYQKVDGWTFTRGDGLRRLVFLPVHPVNEGPEQRAVQLLMKSGAAEVKAQGGGAVGVLRGAPDVGAALYVSAGGELWAGALLLGPVAAPLEAEVRQALADCKLGAPVVEASRIWDETHRVSCVLPAGARGAEVRGGGAAEGGGWVVRLIAAQPKTSASLQEVAAGWLAASGARSAAQAELTSAAGLHAVSLSGPFVRNGVTYVGEAVAVDLGDQVVGFGLSANEAVAPAARAALRAMLDSLSYASVPSSTPQGPLPPPSVPPAPAEAPPPPPVPPAPAADGPPPPPPPP